MTCAALFAIRAIKLALFIAAVNTIVGLAAADEAVNITVSNEEFDPIFNGKDLTGWYTYLETQGKNSDPQQVIQVDDGMLHMYKDAEHGSQMPTGYLGTEADYANYHLRLQYRWGEKKFKPWLNRKRDAGVLYHAIGFDGAVGLWPRSNEFQIQQGDVGDIISVLIRETSTVDLKTPSDPLRFLPAADGGVVRSFGDRDAYVFQSQSDNFEVEGWNTIDLVVRDNGAEHYVNGKLVNACSALQQPDPTDPSKWLPLTKGRILLQAEGAEIFYRNVMIKELEPIVANTPRLSVGAGNGSFTADPAD